MQMVISPLTLVPSCPCIVAGGPEAGTRNLRLWAPPTSAGVDGRPEVASPHPAGLKGGPEPVPPEWGLTGMGPAGSGSHAISRCKRVGRDLTLGPEAYPRL